MTTTLPNPHYSPETSVKVTIINFSITYKGLVEQMIAKVVNIEQPELEERKDSLMRDMAMNNKTLKECEDRIL